MNLFVYGTLLIPKIWHAVSGLSDLHSEPAELSGFSIFRVRDADFPAIIESSSEVLVPGRVHFDVPASAMERLDAYEDSFYVRREVIVTTSTGTAVGAHAYIVLEPYSPFLTDEHWTLEWFENHALHRYWENHFA